MKLFRYVVLLAGLSALAFATPAAASHGGLPGSIVGLGDSITAAWGAAGAPFERRTASWSTGNLPAVNSHYQRLLALNPKIEGKAMNLAISGTRAAELLAQVEQVPQGTGYVTLTVGSTELCTTHVDAVEELTPPAAFADSIRAVLSALVGREPQVHILVLSIPNWYSLWERLQGDPDVASWWAKVDICPLLLQGRVATPETREAVRVHTIAYNSALADVCAEFPTNCRFDNEAVYNHPFSKAELSDTDGFHLSMQGQAKMAELAWNVGWYADLQGAALDALTVDFTVKPRIVRNGRLLVRLRTEPGAEVRILLRDQRNRLVKVQQGRRLVNRVDVTASARGRVVRRLKFERTKRMRSLKVIVRVTLEGEVARMTDSVLL